MSLKLITIPLITFLIMLLSGCANFLNPDIHCLSRIDASMLNAKPGCYTKGKVKQIISDYVDQRRAKEAERKADILKLQRELEKENAQFYVREILLKDAEEEVALEKALEEQGFALIQLLNSLSRPQTLNVHSPTGEVRRFWLEYLNDNEVIVKEHH